MDHCLYATVIPVWEANVQERTGKEGTDNKTKHCTGSKLNCLAEGTLCFLSNKVLLKDGNIRSNGKLLLRRAKHVSTLSLCPSLLPAGEEMLTHKSLVKLSILKRKKNSKHQVKQVSEVSPFPPSRGTPHSLCKEWAIKYNLLYFLCTEMLAGLSHLICSALYLQKVLFTCKWTPLSCHP